MASRHERVKRIVVALFSIGCLGAGACGYLIWSELLRAQHWILRPSGRAALAARESPQALLSDVRERASSVAPGLQPKVMPSPSGDIHVTLYGFQRDSGATGFALSAPGEFAVVPGPFGTWLRITLEHGAPSRAWAIAAILNAPTLPNGLVAHVAE